ncbi:UDP-N-acetylglucosamine 2-epimerase (non-hydrolyzing) [Oscillospiraceae bacterium MB08-C2-2]|nr:UDP-N-acetylglucosamine 2-epimerase (non-hydrolyzing) [Oscillospiraceae bacterium MB08-C2-2]
MAPLVTACRQNPAIETIVCITGQHRQMLHEVLDKFGILPDYDLNIMQPGQTLTQITSRILTGLDDVFQKVRPDVVLVHGDTSTALSAGLEAFYHQIPVGHVEAGLRTGNPCSPFPEEMNRVLLGNLACLHFAPTDRNRENLLRQNVPGKIFVTGNTAIDVLRYTVSPGYVFSQPILNQLDYSRPTILLTAHRRENLGEGMESIFAAVRRLGQDFPEIQFILPVHLNPAVVNLVEKELGSCDFIHRTQPLDVFDMHNLISRCYMLMTDSGGLQEEAPSLKKPVLVLREETERMEAIEAGTAILAGIGEESVYACAARLLTDPQAYSRMSGAVNPFGDGHAAEKIVAALLEACVSRHTRKQ